MPAASRAVGRGGAARQGLRQPFAGSWAGEAAALFVVLLSPGGGRNQEPPHSPQGLPGKACPGDEPLSPASSTAGWILIDRCGKHFGTILNYLRDGAVPLPESRREIEELLAEAKYYLVQGLVEECQASLQVGVPPPSLRCCAS